MNKQIGLSIEDELIVDNFAGGGGASCGIELALGRPVDIAVNHDPEAVAMHRANHPQTQHYCESVFEIEPEVVTKGRPVGLAWFSPDCKHFSKAKGKKPRSKNIRGLAWVVIHWVNKVKPRVIMLENVEEFQGWGPLNGKDEPHGHRKGWYFDCFVGALRRRGYKVEWRAMRASSYGAATIRKRFFLVARCDGRPIVWPDPTHGDPKDPESKRLKLKPWRTAAEFIDWAIKAYSIFMTPEEVKALKLRIRRPLADATMARTARGMFKFVLGQRKPFIVQTGYGERPGQKPRVQDVEKPLGTIVAGGVKHAVVAPYLTEFSNSSTQRTFAADEPLRTQCAQVKGGHFALVAPFLAKHYTGVVGSDLRDPIGTVTSIDHHSLVAANIVKLRGTCRDGQPIDEPLHTVSAQGTHHSLACAYMTREFGESNAASVDEPAPTVMPGGMGKTRLVAAFLAKYYGSGNDYQALDEPLHTVRTKDCFQLVTVEIDGQTYVIYDIGLRMLQPHELYGMSGFPKEYIHTWGYFEEDGKLERRKLTTTTQVRMVGNAVPPVFSEALARANVPELAVNRKVGVA